jgi:hypothetical protein
MFGGDAELSERRKCEQTGSARSSEAIICLTDQGFTREIIAVLRGLYAMLSELL